MKQNLGTHRIFSAKDFVSSLPLVVGRIVPLSRDMLKPQYFKTWPYTEIRSL